MSGSHSKSEVHHPDKPVPSTEAQQNLLQSQKMEASGTLVAGMAHEINNPINLIELNLSIFRDIWLDFLPILKCDHQKNPNRKYGGLPFSHIEEKLNRLLSDMKDGANRISKIVGNLIYLTDELVISQSMLKQNKVCSIICYRSLIWIRSRPKKIHICLPIQGFRYFLRIPTNLAQKSKG